MAAPVSMPLELKTKPLASPKRIAVRNRTTLRSDARTEDSDVGDSNLFL